MSRLDLLADRIAAFLQKHNQAFCESCLIERLIVASRTAMRAALAMDRFTVRIGVCADCRTRKQVVTPKQVAAPKPVTTAKQPAKQVATPRSGKVAA
jgi:hypothetical protein